MLFFPGILFIIIFFNQSAKLAELFSGTIFIIATFSKMIVFCQFNPSEHESEVRFKKLSLLCEKFKFQKGRPIGIKCAGVIFTEQNQNKIWFLLICNGNRGLIFSIHID